MLKQKRFKFRNTCIKIGVCFLLAACSSSGSGSSGPRPCATFDCKEMLNNLGTNIMMPTIQQFKTDADAMKTAVDTYFAALGSGDEGTERIAAQDAWKAAMATWQAVELMQIGPADKLSGLRDTIYSWPVINTCNVDQEVTFADSGVVGTTSYDITKRQVDQRGLDALGYVLFSDTLDHSCIGTNPIPNWNGRTPADRTKARATYAQLAAADVAAQAAILATDWIGFLVELKNPGSSGSRFSTVEEAVNVVSDALFYYEDEVKDIKLAEPLGLKENVCNTTNVGCALALESPFSMTSKENIKNNLLAFQELFLGNKPGVNEEALGFAEFLDTMGGANTSDALKNGITAAIPAVEAMPDQLKVAVMSVSGYVFVKDAWDAAKVVTDQLKLNFLEVLKLNIPGSAAGDGD